MSEYPVIKNVLELFIRIPYILLIEPKSWIRGTNRLDIYSELRPYV